MPIPFAPILKNTWIAGATILFAMITYHFILKLFSLREAANNLKVLSETLKNVEGHSLKSLEMKEKLMDQISSMIDQLSGSRDLEQLYRELFVQVSRLICYVFLGGMLLFIGWIAGLGLAYRQVPGMENPIGSVSVTSFLLIMASLVAVVFFLMRGLPKQKPLAIWVAIPVLAGLVIGTTMMDRIIKSEEKKALNSIQVVTEPKQP